MLPERIYEILAGSAVIVLATVWVLDKRPPRRLGRALLALWWIGWFGAAGFSYYALEKAEGALAAPADQRQWLLATWLDRAMTARIVSLLVIVLGLCGVVAAWARRGGGGAQGASGEGGRA